ncbi:hypothetical protein Tco_0523845 [Tanacetum coccineum]
MFNPTLSVVDYRKPRYHILESLDSSSHLPSVSGMHMPVLISKLVQKPLKDFQKFDENRGSRSQIIVYRICFGDASSHSHQLGPETFSGSRSFLLRASAQTFASLDSFDSEHCALVCTAPPLTDSASSFSREIHYLPQEMPILDRFNLGLMGQREYLTVIHMSAQVRALSTNTVHKIHEHALVQLVNQRHRLEFLPPPRDVSSLNAVLEVALLPIFNCKFCAAPWYKSDSNSTCRVGGIPGQSSLGKNFQDIPRYKTGTRSSCRFPIDFIFVLPWGEVSQLVLLLLARYHIGKPRIYLSIGRTFRKHSGTNSRLVVKSVVIEAHHIGPPYLKDSTSQLPISSPASRPLWQYFIIYQFICFFSALPMEVGMSCLKELHHSQTIGKSNNSSVPLKFMALHFRCPGRCIHEQLARLLIHTPKNGYHHISGVSRAAVQLNTSSIMASACNPEINERCSTTVVRSAK